MKQSIQFTVITLVVTLLCLGGFYLLENVWVNTLVSFVFCISFTTFLLGCSLIWSHATKKHLSDSHDVYGGCILMVVSMVLIITLMFGTATNTTMFITIATSCSGIILLMSSENKRRWLKNKKQMATKPTTIVINPSEVISTKVMPRKVSQAEFKRIMQFCKENNLGHLTLSQAIVAWDEYCEFVTP